VLELLWYRRGVSCLPFIFVDVGVRQGVVAYVESTSSIVESTCARPSLAAQDGGGRVIMVRPGWSPFSFADMFDYYLCVISKR